MKTNAVIRIVIWSLVIVLLVSTLGVGLYRADHRPTDKTPVETVVPASTSPMLPVKEAASYATVIANAVNIRTTPNSDSQAVGMLEKNESVIIGRQEKVNGEDWAYITQPVSGWMKCEYLAMNDQPKGPSDGEIALDPNHIREIDIEWAAGHITIESADVSAILISESANSPKAEAMVWKENNNKLIIRYRETTVWLGTTLNDVESKNLTIQVPMGWTCDTLEIDTASAIVDVKNLGINEVDFDSASGTCNFANCVVNELDIDTASGDISFSGSLMALDCDAASASVFAVFDNVPNRIDMDSMSGNLDITLPSSAGFTVSLDALSSDFVCEFGYAQNKDHSYYRGDGKCKINLDAMSGDLYIREFKEATASPVGHHHTDECNTNPESCPDNSSHHTEAHHN